MVKEHGKKEKNIKKRDRSSNMSHYCLITILRIWTIPVEKRPVFSALEIVKIAVADNLNHISILMTVQRVSCKSELGQ